MSQEPEFDPHAPGPPREVSEDAAARGRSMTAEEWARELAWTISGTTFHGHDDFIHKVRAIATKTIAKAEAQAHAAGKAEGAAEERQADAEKDLELCGGRLLLHEDEHGNVGGLAITGISGGADYIGDYNDGGYPRTLHLTRLDEEGQSTGMKYVAQPVDTIADAQEQARREEREACAQLIEWFAREAGRGLYPDLAREEALDRVTTAIRQRSEAPDE